MHYEGAKENVKLEQLLIEAHYLGMSMRAIAGDRNFRYASITQFVSSLLIGWARQVGARLQDGERVFSCVPDAEPAPPFRRNGQPRRGQ